MARLIVLNAIILYNCTIRNKILIVTINKLDKEVFKMTEFRKNGFIFKLEQNTVMHSNCSLKMYDDEYNLIKIKAISIEKLSNFLLEEFYK